VVFVLLSWPRLVDAPIRVIGTAAGVSVGSAAETLEMLHRSGFLGDDVRPRRLRRRDELRELWTAAYPMGLGSALTTRSFGGDPGSIALPDDVQGRSSGELAAPGLRGSSAIVYVSRWDPRMPFLNRWRTDAEPNIFIRDRFWSEVDVDDPGAHGRALSPAPPLLVYADLMASGDGRQRGAAEAIREGNPDLHVL
jgi:hypothetical protein